MPELDPNKEYTIDELVDYIRNAMTGKNVREALARSVKATNDIAVWARDVAQGLIDGAFDAGELATMIESKLNQLEQDYAPTLSGLESELEEAKGNSDSLAGRLNSISNQLTETGNELSKTTKELAKKQSYEGSLVELLKMNSVLRNEILVKVVSPNEIEVGVFHQANRVTFFTFKPDGDGWRRQFQAVVRPVTEIEVLENYKKGSNFTSKTGEWIEAEPTYYTTEVGATFSGEFEGTGLNFNHRTDNRGGIWEFVIDGYITKRISTFSTTTRDNVGTLIAKGLPNGNHSFVATFKGADPNNAPSGGTARGWANFYTGTGLTPKTITPYIRSYEGGTGVSVLQETSRKEFAFSVRTAESNLPARWIPEHGNLGAMKNINTKILLDNVELSDLARETTDNYRIYKDIKFITTYDGYYTENDTKVWSARIDQTVNGEGYHVRHKINFSESTEIVVGYPVMLAVSKTNTGNDYVVSSLGDRYYLNPNINDGSSVTLSGEPVSVAHFTNQSGFQELKNIVAAFEVYDYKRTMRVGEEGRPENPTRVELRNDGERKTYYSAFEYHTVEPGEEYDFGCTFFIGEIFNATDILP